MTETSSWTERDLLAFFCRCAIREGHSARAALGLWRSDGGTVSNTLFYAIWNATKRSMLR